MEIENYNQKLTKKERKELRRREKIKEEREKHLKRLYRRITLWLIVFLSIGGAIFGMVKLASQSSNNFTASILSPPTNDDWVKGNKESKVVLVEYSDFQCPACAAYYFVLKKLFQEFGNDIQFVYRHFPLRRIHPNSQLAAQASEAAGIQGKFWEMHDMIFENQQEWSRKNRDRAEEIFISYAKRLNLDIERFKDDLNSEKVKDKVNSDYQSGIEAKINATPTFFLNGKKIQNPRSYEEFRNIINQVINNNS